jgi:hypothetical protein
MGEVSRMTGNAGGASYEDERHREWLEMKSDGSRPSTIVPTLVILAVIFGLISIVVLLVR